MPYVAHAAYALTTYIDPAETNFWRTIKQVDNIEYRWKYARDGSCHVLAGVFEDPNAALNCAKEIYVTLFYQLMRQHFSIADEGCAPFEALAPFRSGHKQASGGYDGDETFFFWNKRYIGGRIGPGVFEVDHSIDEFDDYQFMTATIQSARKPELDLIDVDQHLFTYCREAQVCLSAILLAENAGDLGLQMTIYCGLLEHLSKSADKDPETLAVIDQLIKLVDKSGLLPTRKLKLKNFLNSGRKVSSRQRCRELCAKYAKPEYGGHKCKKIINDAYGLRSAFSHGERADYFDSPCDWYMKFVVLDVVEGIMREREGIASSSNM